MSDVVGRKVVLNLLGGALFVVGILMMNGLIRLSLTGNGLYDAMIVLILGVLLFIVSKILSN